MALLADLPNLDPELFQAPSLESLGLPPSSCPAPKVLLLYGSLRERSFSRLAVEEAARLLNAMGAETHIFNKLNLLPKTIELTNCTILVIPTDYHQN